MTSSSKPDIYAETSAGETEYGNRNYILLTDLPITLTRTEFPTGEFRSKAGKIQRKIVISEYDPNKIAFDKNTQIEWRDIPVVDENAPDIEILDSK